MLAREREKRKKASAMPINWMLLLLYVVVWYKDAVMMEGLFRKTTDNAKAKRKKRNK